MAPQRKGASRAGAQRKCARKANPNPKASSRAGTMTRKAERSPGTVPGKSQRGKGSPARQKATDDSQDSGPRIVKGDVHTSQQRSEARPRPPARRTRATIKRNQEIEHMQRDPRFQLARPDARFARSKRDPRKEGSMAIARRVRRMDVVVNWFRRAPKPKGVK